ncbi:MAG TPA: hypothetical protein VGZ47_22480, partial [Gemmataceae bacterium]|nr:hypothetical protein [Gemmataceae bacterium]
MSQRIPFVYSTECRRPLASALALCLTLVAGCIHLEPEPLAPSTPSPQREQGKPSGVSWKNPFDNHDAAVVPAQVVLPESDSAPAKKPPVPSISPEPPTAAALL